MSRRPSWAVWRSSVGFWAVMHETRSDYAQILTSSFLLVVGPGPWSLDALLRLRGSQTPAFEWTSDLLAWGRSREKFPRLAWSLRADGVPMRAVDCAPRGPAGARPGWRRIRPS